MLDVPQASFASTNDWTVAAVGRRRYLQETGENAMEFWGLHTAINHVFVGLATVQISEGTPVEVGRGSNQETEV
jgi:hypothetical protein